MAVHLRSRLVSGIESLLKGGRFKLLQTSGRKGYTTALYQVLDEWRDGGLITARSSRAMFDHLQGAGLLTAAGRKEYEGWVVQVNEAHRTERQGSLPRKPLAPKDFLERLEAKAIDLRSLRDPRGFITSLNGVTAASRASKGIPQAMNWAWHFANYLTSDADHLAVGDGYRFEAAAYAAWYMSWMGLQIESTHGVKTALDILVKLDAAIDRPSIKSARWTVASYYERISHPSDKYPNVAHAQTAFNHTYVKKGDFPGDLDDPLISYNASNELRLLKCPLDMPQDLFGGRSLREQLLHNIDEAVALGRDQEAMRIRSSLVRGLMNEHRHDEAYAAVEAMKRTMGPQSQWMLSSRANVLHATGLVEFATGDDGGAEKLIRAAQIYERDLKAKKRAEDVRSDFEKLQRARPMGRAL